MANICDEIRIIFRGPCERLFVAYKPLGWHVCSPSGKKKFEDSLSSVIASKLRVSEDSIKFPSKLKINQKGLVIGTTDDSMYSQISKIMNSSQCTKSYTCIINDSFKDLPSKNRGLSITLDNSTQYNSELSGRIDFNLEKYPKNSLTDPDVLVNPLPHTNPFSLKFKISDLTSYVDRFEDSIGYLKGNLIASIDSNQYSVMEIETTNKFVDKHLYQILDNLGINVINEYNKRLNENCKMIQLSKITIPHPILRDRIITSKVSFPILNWINQLQ